VLYGPALQARIPAIVGTGPLLSSANSLTSASGGIVRLIGGPLGGVLLAVCGIRWLICADAVSYLLSAAAMLATSRSGGGRPNRNALAGTVARDLAEGMRALRGQPVARALLPVTVIFLTANALLSAVLIPFGIRQLGGTAHTGLMLSCLGAGYLLGAPVARTLLDRAEPRNLLTVSLTANACAYFLLFTSSSLGTALPAAVAVAMCGSMTLIIQQTTLQRVIPDAVLGRVSAVFLTGAAAAALIGAAAGPFITQAAHLTGAAAAASLLTLGAAALALRTVPRRRSSSPTRSLNTARSGHGEQADQVVDEVGVQGFAGCQGPVPDGAEHDVGDRAGGGAGRQVAPFARAVGDHGERFPTALEEGGAETVAELRVNLRLGHQPAQQVGQPRVAGHLVAGLEERPQVGAVAAVIGHRHVEVGLGRACLQQDVGLGRPPPVDGLLADAGPRGDALDGETAVADVGRQFERGHQRRLPGRLAARPSWRSSSAAHAPMLQDVSSRIVSRRRVPKL
jgi:predicted MFS family arabinose efflux permease